MKKKNLLQTLILVLSLTMTNQFADAQDCSPGIWSCYYTPSGYYCGCADSTSIYAQSCPTGYQLACRLNPRCEWICECIATSKIEKWLSQSHKCGNNGHNPHWHWRSSENEENLQYETLLEGVYPNPVFHSTTISFSISNAQRVSIQVFDMKGRLISTIADQVFNKGENKLAWCAGQVSDGIYILRMVAGEVIQTEKIMIIK